MLNPSEIERALVVVAHPDDVDFGAAGTIATLTDAGVTVTYCLVTSGDAGGFDDGIDRAAMAGIREDEQTTAAKEVGVTELVFLGRPDGRVVADLDLRRDISRVIRQVRPDVVITQSPEVNLDFVYAGHPDHRATGEATLAAVYPDSRNPYAHPELLTEGLDAWSVQEMWVMTSPGGTNTPMDITDQFERKMAALLSHRSQHPDPDGMATRVRAWNGMNATNNGLPEGRLAEVFRVVNTR